jgi:hypothetical protein
MGGSILPEYVLRLEYEIYSRKAAVFEKEKPKNKASPTEFKTRKFSGHTALSFKKLLEN